MLAHGLTATRRYVVMGSTALAARRAPSDRLRRARARRVIARREPGGVRYEDLGADLEAVLDHAGVQRAVLAGASMGAHTLLWLALHRPERVAGLVIITPAFSGAEDSDPQRLAHWDALSDGPAPGRDRRLRGRLRGAGRSPSAGARR